MTCPATSAPHRWYPLQVAREKELFELHPDAWPHAAGVTSRLPVIEACPDCQRYRLVDYALAET